MFTQHRAQLARMSLVTAVNSASLCVGKTRSYLVSSSLPLLLRLVGRAGFTLCFCGTRLRRDFGHRCS